MSKIKSQYDVQQMRISGRIAAEIVQQLSTELRVGQSAGEVDQRARELCAQNGVKPAFLGYQGFSGAICISVNDEVVHGIPYDTKIFAEADLIKLDFGVIYNGYYSDHCRTFPVGKITDQQKQLLAAGEAATLNAVSLAKVGNRIGDLSHAMQSTAESAGFSVVRSYVGHGIGKKLHEEPEVPAFGEPSTGPFLQENMIICIECQVCEGSAEIIHDKDGWTSRTKDGEDCVMFEHMVRITVGEPEVLTALPQR